MNIGLVTEVRNGRVQIIRDAIDAAATPGYLALYDGDQPSTGGAASGNLLGKVLLQQPCGTIDTGVLTFLFGDDNPAALSGDPTWGRFCDGDDNPVMDGAVGVGELIQIDTDAIYTGGLLSGAVSSTLTEGNA